MQKKRILMITFALGALLSVEAQNTIPEIRQSIERGRELFEAGQWTDARHEFRMARRDLKPSDREALEQVDFYLAACAVELGNSDAVVALHDFERRHPRSVYTDDVNFSLGSYYCSVGNMKQAAAYFSKTDYGSLSATRREQYDIRMGYVEFTNRNYEQAYRYFDRIHYKSEYVDHAIYYKSYIHYIDKKYPLAKQGFYSLRDSEAYGDVVPYFLLQIEFQEGNDRYVVEQGELLAQKSVKERRAEIERVVAQSWYRLEDYHQTVAHLNAYFEADGTVDRESAYLMGFSLYRSTRYEEAEQWLKKACGAKDALTQNASYHLADCYLRKGDKKAAMQCFGMAADEQFDREVAEDALFNYGKLQYELGGGVFNGAINTLQRYVSSYPKSKRQREARTLLIAAYYNSQDYDAAYRAIKSMPSNDAEIRAALQKITYFRGLQAYEAGRIDEARKYLGESARVGVSPKLSAMNTFWQAEMAYAKQDYTLATVKYQTFLKQAPRDAAEYAYAWYNLGYCAFMTQKFDDAKRSFERFVDLHASKDAYRADAYNRLGDIALADRKFEVALQNYNQGLHASGSIQQYAQYKRAFTYGIMGKKAEQQKILRDIVAQGKGDYSQRATYELGRAYIAQEKYGEGTHILERFVVNFPSSPLRLQAMNDLGLAYLNLGNKQKSEDYYKRVVEEAPHSSQARNAMQGIREIYMSRNDVNGYFAYAERAGMESDLTQLSRDSLSFVAAQKIYLKDQGDLAAKSLRSYLASYPKGSYIDDALYYLSDCYLKLDERKQAIESLTALTQQNNSRYMLPALEQLSKITFEEKRFEQSAEAYRKLYDVANTQQARQDAMLGYARATIQGGNLSQIEKMTADVVKHKDSGKMAQREARFALAEALRRVGRRAEAVSHYEILSQEVQTAEGSAAGYYVIEDLFAKNEFDKAEKAVFKYSERQPRAYWLAKSYILLGDIYLQKGDAFQARATWQSVADGYSLATDGIVDEATKRIRNLK